MASKEQIEEKIKEIKKTIKKFADNDLYSANCTEVKYLYKQLHQLEAELEGIKYKEPEENDYEPFFIGDSDVPLYGDYE